MGNIEGTKVWGWYWKKRKRNKLLYTALVHISEKPIMGMVRGTQLNDCCTWLWWKGRNYVIRIVYSNNYSGLKEDNIGRS